MKIRIGTRKSKLALAQTKMVETALHNAFPYIETEIIHITTKGDKILDKQLSQIGGKGLFISEIEKSLIKNEIDIAVHSAKDLPVEIADGLEISGVLKRGSVRECLILRSGERLENSEKFVIGTGSIRRRMNMKKIYSDVVFSDIRGNVDTRINKLISGEYDGIILAEAGLERLGIHSDKKITILPFEVSEFLPAPCQAVIAVESRINDKTASYIKKICDYNTFYSFETERYIIKKIGGDCGIPLGAFSHVSDGNININISMHCEKVLNGSDSVNRRFELAERLVKEL